MKVVLFFAAVVLAACVSAENCTMNSIQQDCTHMTCSNGFHKECVNAVCTCNPNVAISCTYQNDCTTTYCGRPGGWHCVDNFCRCGGNFGK